MPTHHTNIPKTPPTSSSLPPHSRGIKRKFLGFTLVELIVVITILVILGTIAFLNLGGFSSSARDSARISNLANLQKGLNVYQVKTGTYPTPESSVAITASGVTIGYQGFAKDIVGGIAKLSKGGTVDPSDSNIYTTYAVNQTLTKMQAMVFLEDSTNVTAWNPTFITTPTFISTTYAATTTDYSKRFPKTSGDTLGILLSTATGTLNQPVQETGTGVDVLISTGTYKVYISTTNTLSGSGNAFIPLLTNYDNSISTYPGCDTKDIKLPNGQVWAACNVGATTAYMNQTFTSTGAARTPSINAWAGGYYQWGRNDDVTTGGTGAIAATGTLAGGVGHSNFITAGTTPYDWIAVQNDNLWGGSGTTATGGTYISQGSPAVMQGPCQTGYHMPTQLEWCNAILSVSPINSSGSALTCTNGWKSEATANLFRTTLRLPLSGFRDDSTALYNSQGVNGRYWSSSPNSSNGYNVYVSSTLGVFPLNNNSRANGFAVRCLKN